MNGDTGAGTVKHLYQQPRWWDGVHPHQTHRSNPYSHHVETVFLLGVCEATVSSFTSPSTEVRSKNWMLVWALRAS